MFTDTEIDVTEEERIAVTDRDLTILTAKQKEYGTSWKSRGGVGAFMMLARKWDRIELACEREKWDIFAAVAMDGSDAGLLDDIGDLRRYLILVEAQLRRVSSPGRGLVTMLKGDEGVSTPSPDFHCLRCSVPLCKDVQCTHTGIDRITRHHEDGTALCS